MERAWIQQRHELPNERPDYPQKEEELYDAECVRPPMHDETCDDEAPVVDASVVGAQLLLNRARHAAFAFGKTVRQDAKYAARRAELRLKHLGKCNCAQVVHKDTCPQSYWHKYNALVMIREEERAVVQAMRVAEKAAGKFAEKERETSLKKNKRILSDVERCAAAVEERMK